MDLSLFGKRKPRHHMKKEAKVAKKSAKKGVSRRVRKG